MNISIISDDELVQLRIKVDKELNRRKIKFSVGEIGEIAAVNYFNHTPGIPNLQKAPTGVKNVDALSRDGHRYSIKTIQNGKKTGTIYPDNEDKDTQLFEYLLLVVLDESYNLKELNRFTWKDFLAVRAWDKRMNAWYIPLSSKSISVAETIFSKDKKIK